MKRTDGLARIVMLVVPCRGAHLEYRMVRRKEHWRAWGSERPGGLKFFQRLWWCSASGVTRFG